MRSIAIGGVLAVALTTPAHAHDALIQHRNDALREKVIRLHGERAPGRDIVRYGLSTGEDATTEQVHRYFDVLRRMTQPYTVYLKPAEPKLPPAGTASLRVTSPPLAKIRACESGGNYQAIDPSGTYRGAYQFDRGTWAGVGGSGDPAAASPAEQDRRAAMLYAQRGSAPWPVCGR